MILSIQRRLDRLWVIWQTLRVVFWLGLAALLVVFYVLVWTKVITLPR